MNFYNEIDLKAAQWLRELISDGLIPKGVVDERDIRYIKPEELDGYTQCHFFAGIGGWSYALRLAGWPEDRPVWTGSCPCQPFSVAGKRGGTEDARHLWPTFRWLIAQCRPATVFGEQVASPAGRSWLSGVRSDLEVLGYAFGGADLCAAGVGAPHIRARLWWVAQSEAETQGSGTHGGLADSQNDGQPRSQTPRDGRSGSSYGEPDSGVSDTKLPSATRQREQCGESEHQQKPERPGASSRMAGSNNTGPQGRDGAKLRECTNERAPWSSSTYHQCRDGKARRIPTEPVVFDLLSDGVSAILGSVWSSCYVQTEREVAEYAKKTNTRPGEVLRTLWETYAEKEVQREAGGQGGFCEKTLLLIALCKLQRGTQPETETTAQDFSEIEERTMRTVWASSQQPTASSCSPHQRGLEGPQQRESQDAMCGVPPQATHQTGGEMSCVREASKAEQDVLKTLSALGEILRPALDEEKHWKQRLADCKGWAGSLSLYPLCNTLPGRVGLLRGAGNAIVPQVAAKFIKSTIF